MLRTEHSHVFLADKSIRVLIMLGLVFALGGCGGGGSSSTAATPVVPPAADTTPDAFAFTARVDVERDTLIESNTIRVTGINAEAAISISAGEYAINNGAFTGTAGSVRDGDDVRVRLTSSPDPATQRTATLSIGGVDGSFSVTTKADGPGAAKSTSVMFLTSRLPESQGALTETVARAQFARSKALIERLSYGRHTLSLHSIHDLGTTNFTRAELRAWSTTAGLLSRVLRDEGRDPYVVECDLTVEGPKAQALLDGLSQAEKAQTGIVIDTIDLGFARTLQQNRCRDFSAGGILATTINLPESVDYTQVDQIVYAPFDEEVHAGGYNIGFQFADIQRPAAMAQADAARIEFVMSGAVDTALNTPVAVNSEGVGSAVSSASYLQDAAYVQTEFSRITTHEIVHGLGIGTHDNGIESTLAVADAAVVNRDPIAGATAHNLEYGDDFSLMGRSQYAVGVSPAVKEYLGWLTPDRMHVITTGDGGERYALAPYANTSGVVAARLRVFGDRGFVYVTFESSDEEYRTLNHPGLFDNSQGAILRFAQNNGAGALSTSILLDPDGQPGNHDYTLKAGQSFTIGGVSISISTVSEEALVFRVAYQ